MPRIATRTASDTEEFARGTDPYVAGTDDDTLCDGKEVYAYGTDPGDRDTDGGGLIDGDKVKFWGKNPLDPWDGEQLG